MPRWSLQLETFGAWVFPTSCLFLYPSFLVYLPFLVPAFANSSFRPDYRGNSPSGFMREVFVKKKHKEEEKKKVEILKI
jgi:hypothetical protein